MLSKYKSSSSFKSSLGGLSLWSFFVLSKYKSSASEALVLVELAALAAFTAVDSLLLDFVSAELAALAAFAAVEFSLLVFASD